MLDWKTYVSGRYRLHIDYMLDWKTYENGMKTDTK